MVRNIQLFYWSVLNWVSLLHSTIFKPCLLSSFFALLSGIRAWSCLELRYHECALLWEVDIIHVLAKHRIGVSEYPFIVFTKKKIPLLYKKISFIGLVVIFGFHFWNLVVQVSLTFKRRMWYLRFIKFWNYSSITLCLCVNNLSWKRYLFRIYSNI